MTSFNPDRGKLRWQLKDKLLSEGWTATEVCSDAGLIEAAVKCVFDSVGVERIEAARKEKAERKSNKIENFAQVGYITGKCRSYKVMLAFGKSDDLMIFANFSRTGHPFVWEDRVFVWASIRMPREVIIPKP